MIVPAEWFRLPETGSGSTSDPYRPAYVDSARAYSGSKSFPGGAPLWIARVYADQATLDAIDSQPDATRLSDSEVVDALNRMESVGPARDSIEEWNSSFRSAVDV